MFEVPCLPASGAYIVKSDAGTEINGNPRFLNFLGQINLSHRLHAETTPEFDQWMIDYNIGSAEVLLDAKQGVSFVFAAELDAMLFKLRWL